MGKNKEDSVEAVTHDMNHLRDRLLKIAQRSRQTGTPGKVSPRSTLAPRAKATMKPEEAKKATTPKPAPPPREPISKPRQPRGVVPPHLKKYLFKKKG